jgi:hypothetical protein
MVRAGPWLSTSGTGPTVARSGTTIGAVQWPEGEEAQALPAPTRLGPEVPPPEWLRAATG